jgi:hypothetical protein
MTETAMPYAPPAFGLPDPFNDSQPRSTSPSTSAKDEVLPDRWYVVQEYGKYICYQKSEDGKSAMPLGQGRTRDEAIKDARNKVERAKQFRHLFEIKKE